MCGISCFICSTCHDHATPNLETLLAKRGPDSTMFHKVLYQESTSIVFCASVLSMRSVKSIKQPLVNDDGSVLIFNGEIYSGLGNVSRCFKMMLLFNVFNFLFRLNMKRYVILSI